MIRRSNRRGRIRTKSIVGLTQGDVPAGENNPVNEGVVESSTHEVAQRALRNISNIEQLFDWEAQIMTTVLLNLTHVHGSHANTIERVRSLRARSFNSFGEPYEAES